MRRRLPIIIAALLLIAALAFLVKRREAIGGNPATGAARETIAEDPASSRDPGDSTARKTTALPDSPRLSAPAETKTLGTMPGNFPATKANPYPANIPVVVGAKTFVPKAAPDLPEPQAAVALDKVRSMLRDYRTLYHENPVGTNAEIMKAVMGGNPKQAQLGPPEGQTLNANGEIVDQWGTPYFFHQLSSDLMEIRSAGPDKTLWTSDDIVTK